MDPTLIADRVERFLEDVLSDIQPPGLAECMRYAVLGGGKRIRPTLCLLAAEAVGGEPEKALPAACAVELIHAYSLVHDDLPAMDNAALRRGKPSCHAAFGEAQAVLAGDALLTLAFQVIAQGTPPGLPVARLVAEVAEASGWAGMAGGQWDDLRTGIDYADVVRRKTAALISCPLVCGGICGGASEAQLEALRRFGEALGRLFQWTDDLLDGDGAVRIQGPDAARREAERLAAEAKAAIARLGPSGAELAGMADKILQRSH